MANVRTAVSLPEELFASLEAIARRTGRSRSSIVAEALERQMRQEESELLTRKLNEIYSGMSEAEVQEDMAWVRLSAAQMAAQLDTTDSGWGVGEHKAR